VQNPAIRPAAKPQSIQAQVARLITPLEPKFGADVGDRDYVLGNSSGGPPQCAGDAAQGRTLAPGTIAQFTATSRSIGSAVLGRAE